MKTILILLSFIAVILPQNLSAWTLKDSSLVLTLNKESFELAYNSTQLAKSKAKYSLEIASSIGFKFGLAQANSRLGIVYDVEGKFDSSLYYYKTAYTIYKQINNKKGQGAALCNIGLLQLNRNNYIEALSNLHAAIKPLEEVKEYLFLGNCYNNIGLLYNELDNLSRAAYNYKLAIQNYDKCGDVYQKANVISNLAMLYSDLKKNDSSILLEKAAIEIYAAESDYYNIAKNYNNLAILYDETGHPEEAEKAFLLSASYSDSADNHSGMADTYINLASFYSDAGKTNKSNYYTKLAYAMSEDIESPKLKADIYYYYAKICQKEGRYQLATVLLIASKRLKDSIFKKEIAEQIASQEARFGLEKKESENKDLKQKNRIQELELVNRQNQIRSRQIILFSIAGISLLAIAFTIIYLRRRYTMQKLKAENSYREAHQKQRIHISHELHDNVGAQLTYIVSNLGILEESDSENLRVRAVSEMSKQAIITLRETVWALNNESISFTGFADKFKQYAAKILEYQTGIEFVLEEEIESEQILQPIEALNLFRICQEAFNNSVKHSGANTIKVHIKDQTNGILTITIEDNGIGFSEKEMVKKGHFGLQSMRSRAEEIGLEFSLESIVGKGSTIHLERNKNTTYV